MNHTFTIKHAQVVLPHGIVETDVVVENGIIIAIGRGLSARGTVIQAQGLTMIPGVIDPQVHFREPGLTHKEDLYTGSCAAAAGGVTSFFEMPNTQPTTTTLSALAEKRRIAAKNCQVNYAFFFGATPQNLDVILQAENICGIKIFMGSSTGDLLVHQADDIEKIFAHGHKLIAVHAESEALLQENKKIFGAVDQVRLHPKLRDEATALSATSLAVKLSLKYKRRLHILHLTTAEETELLRTIPRENRISAEVCPQHLLLHAPDCYERLGTLAQMNPPIRGARHRSALWQGLLDGVIDCIATDHAPHTLTEKQLPYGQAPSGMPGVETALTVMLNFVNQGKCSLRQVVHWMCQAPAQLYGAKNKGSIAVGNDADLTLIDMQQKKIVDNEKLFTKVKWSPFQGMEFQGWPVQTFVHGHCVFKEGQLQELGQGREVLF